MSEDGHRFKPTQRGRSSPQWNVVPTDPPASHEQPYFDICGPKAIAGIGDLPDAVTDRAVPIRLKRPTPNEPVARFRQPIASTEAAKIILDAYSVPLVPDVPVPDELNDRAADSWEPLIAVADAAGGPWPERARLAAVALSGEEETPVSVGMRLLGDIRDAFGSADHLTTNDLLHRLDEIDDAPWGDWYGSPLAARGLAKLLEPYRAGPRQRRVRGEKSRGYFRSDFTDASARYVPLARNGTAGTSEADATWDDASPVVSDTPEASVARSTPLMLQLPCSACHRLHSVGAACERVSGLVSDSLPSQEGWPREVSALEHDSHVAAKESPRWRCWAGTGHHPAFRADGTVYCGTCHPVSVAESHERETALGSPG